MNQIPLFNSGFNSIKTQYIVERLVFIINQKKKLTDREISRILDGLLFMKKVLTITDDYLQEQITRVALNMLNFKYPRNDQLVVEAVHFYEEDNSFRCYNLLLQHCF
jgi:CRISPR/Cas system-associated endonuclease Cas1